MKVFKGIMNLFPKKMKVASGLSNHAEEDIKFLSMLSSSDTRELYASNGKYYYYFFMINDNYIDIAKFVFARNGFNAEVHNTKYYYTGNGYRAVNQGVEIDGSWYYFKEDGQILTGWREKDGEYYYYDEEGRLLTNQGIKVDESWYYLTGSGRRLRTEFRQKGTDWFYYDAEGRLVKSVELDIEGKHYKFKSSGATYLGWEETEEGQYY